MMKKLLCTAVMLAVFMNVPTMANDTCNTYDDIYKFINSQNYSQEINDYIHNIINENYDNNINDVLNCIKEQLKDKFGICIEVPTQITTNAPVVTTQATTNLPIITTQETTQLTTYKPVITTEVTTNRPVITTEEQTETTTQATTNKPVITTEATTQIITNKPVITTEEQTETTTQVTTNKPVITTEVTTQVTTNKPVITTEEQTETTTQATTNKPVTTTESQTETTTIAQNQSSYAKQVLDLVNAERAKNGVAKLTLNNSLSNVAQIKAEDMRDNNYFSHTSPTYGSPFDMMNKFNISYKTAGENIARGQKTPQAVVNAWMNSEGHRKNILNPSYTQMGIGRSDSSSNYWVQMFIG